MTAPQLPVAPVPADDPKKKPQDETNDTKIDKKDEQEELSEEDQQLKNELEMLVERLREPDTALYRPALETLRTLIRTSTSSMTSVPKPLKFLRPHYPDLQVLYETWPPSDNKNLFADILSVLAMTYSDTQPRGTLKYRLLSTRDSDVPSDPGLWGHEYIRHLAAELGLEYAIRIEAEEDTADLKSLAITCATFLLGHNAEADAVDLLEELEAIEEIQSLVDKNTFERVCTYMVSCVNLLPPPDDVHFLRTAHSIYVQFFKFPEAFALAIRIRDPELVKADFHAPANPLMQRQLALILARAQVPLEWVGESLENPVDGQEPLAEDLFECLTNAKLSSYFRTFGKELGVEDSKSLEDIYKSHLENVRSTAGIDSARANLAGTFVNAFVNAGFGNDKLMAKAEEGSSWVYKNKDHGMLSAAASLGMCLLWDDVGLNDVDKYMYSTDENIKAGAILATGLLHSGIRSESVQALLSEFVSDKSLPARRSAIVGLGLAHAGTHSANILSLLLPVVADESTSMELASLAALSLGIVFTGSCNAEITTTIVETMMERQDKELSEKWARFMSLGLGLLYLGRQDQSDATLELLKVLPHALAKQAQVLVEICSFAGTSNVLKVQRMLHYCTELLDKSKDKDDDKDKKEEDKDKEVKKEDDTFQGFAVIGIALIAMGEDVGAEMALRQFNHLMHYGTPVIRKCVPLALALISASNPQLGILDTLSKYSHDNDLAVALNSILAMGFVGAGTNNARLAQMLRGLAGYYHKEPDCLFMVRIAQGLVHMGKGTISINPFFQDRSIMCQAAVAGLLSTLMAFTDAKAFILDKSHWMLFYLVTAMYPRFMITLDEELNHAAVTVRVGQAVDTVGQAGKPRTISGFQTHQTPVRLGTTERAELGTEEFIPYAKVLEGLVILQKNPGWEKEDRMEM